MGLFGTGTEVRDFTMVRDFDEHGKGSARFSLYPGPSGGRLWVVSFGQWFTPTFDARTGPADDAQYQAFINELNASALVAIRRSYPSAQAVEGPLSGLFPERDPEHPVVSQGKVRVSVKDHQKVLANAAAGQSFAPGPNWRPGG